MSRAGAGRAVPLAVLGVLAWLVPLPGPAGAAPDGPGAVSANSASPNSASVGVRAGRHPDFTRLVFDWGRAVGYRVERSGDRFTVEFDDPAGLDLSQVSDQNLPRLRSVASEVRDGRRVVSLTLEQGGSLRAFRSGTKVVLDISSAAKPSAPSAERAAKPARPAAPGRSASVAGPNAVVDLAVRAVLAEPRAEPVDADRPAPAAGAGTKAAPDQAVRTDPTATVEFELPLGGGAAAAFRRGDRLWLVFDRPLPAGFGAALQRGTPGLPPFEESAVENATVLWFSVPPSVAARLTPSPRGWRVRLGPGDPAPLKDVAIETQAQPSPRLLYKVAAAGRLIEIADPELGDTLRVLPVPEPGLGQSQARRFPEFRSLPTTQGFAFVAYSDTLRVGLGLDGISVIGEKGLLITTENDLPAARASGGPLRSTRPRLFALAAWRLGPGEDFDRNRQRLQKAAGLASEAKGASQRLALARFYFAHGLAAETLSVLREMGAAGDPFLDRPEIVLMRGASHFMARETEKAAVQLALPTMDGQIDAALWRAALAARNGAWASAAELFQESEGLIAEYPRRWRNSLRLLAAEARLGVGDTGGASLYLGQVHEDRPDEIQKARLDLLDARRFLADGRMNAAIDILDRLSRDPHRPTQAQARRILVEQKYASGAVDRAQTIEELERLRFLWRGDEFELELLSRLAELYAEIGDYRTALHRYRQLASRRPGSEESDAAAKKMRQLFARILDDRDGAQVPPLKAVALYEEFRELTPLGSTGVRLIRSLARRLTEVELPSRAAEMLEQTITGRLRGEDRAGLGAQLAEIHLRNAAPEGALSALDRTRVAGASAAVVRDRKHLRAKALADLGREPEGLALLAADTSEPGLRLKLEIAWKLRDWQLAGEALDLMVPETPPQDRLLSDVESRRVINLAIAHTMARKRDALASLRRRYSTAMASSPHGESFRLLTSDFGTADASAIMEELKDVDTVDSFIASYRSSGAEAAAN